MSSNRQEFIGPVADALRRVRRKGVRIWSEKGELRYRAPKGALTREELQWLRSLRCEIVALLEDSVGAQLDESVAESLQQDRAPATFTQLQHWYYGRLDQRPSVRQLASVLRLRGPLDSTALQRSLSLVVQRHEALRTRIVIVDGVPVQEIAPDRGCSLRTADFASLNEGAREVAVRQLIDELILEPVRLDVDPLLAVGLAKLHAEEHVLIATMEHMVSDAYSMNIFLRDLFAIYAEAVAGHPACLPAIGLQFSDYARWQQNTHHSWMTTHGTYWRERMKGCERLRFPTGEVLSSAERTGWGTVQIEFGRELKAHLRDWCRLRRTTVVMAVFTAYVALVLRWCGVSEAVVRYQTDGRANPKVQNAIGFFASVLHLRVGLSDDDTFLDLMHRIISEYCMAYEHMDYSYLEALLPQPPYVRNGRFNWVPQEPDSGLSGDESPTALLSSPITFESPVLRQYDRDSEPTVLLYDTNQGIVGGVHYPRNRFSDEVMASFAQNFLFFVNALLRQPQSRVKDVVLRYSSSASR